MPIVDAGRSQPYGDTPSPKRFGTVSPLDPEFFSTIEEFADELVAGQLRVRPEINSLIFASQVVYHVMCKYYVMCKTTPH